MLKNISRTLFQMHDSFKFFSNLVFSLFKACFGQLFAKVFAPAAAGIRNQFQARLKEHLNLSV